MNILSEINAWQQVRQQLEGKTIGLVATMGNLHEGHLSLLERSLAENEITVATIFVNPTQFNQTSDFDLYPRTIERDSELLQEKKVDYLLLPDAEDMYADHYGIRIMEEGISQTLEGEFRPGHFTGMLTIVLKFLNLVRPTHAYFGEKDYQQYLLVDKMAKALFLPTMIVPCATLRADDQLALSSRNGRLNKEQRSQAAHFPRVLHNHHLTSEQMKAELTSLGFKVEYIEKKWGRRLGAVWLDQVRLIDNIEE